MESSVEVDEATLDALMRAARHFAAITAASLAQVEERVSVTQLRVLVLAWRRRSVNPTAVAEALGVHLSNASRTCDRLVRAGLLDRRELPADRRHLELRLTDDGARLLDAVMAHRRSAVLRVLQQLTPESRRDLARALSAFSDAAEGLDPDEPAPF